MHGHGVQRRAQGLHRALIGGVLIPAPRPAGGLQGRHLGRARQFHAEIACQFFRRNTWPPGACRAPRAVQGALGRRPSPGPGLAAGYGAGHVAGDRGGRALDPAVMPVGRA